MKKIIIILLLILFISGCQYFGRNEEATIMYTRYHQGSQGLELRFSTSAPPSVIYDQPNSLFTDRSEMEVLVEVRNKGAFDIGTTISNRPYGIGYLLLHGYDETIITGLKPIERKGGIIYLDELDVYGEGVEGKSMYNTEGGFTVIEYPPKAKIRIGEPAPSNLKSRSFEKRNTITGKFLGLSQIYSTITLPEGVDYYRPNLVATACYEYYTEASPQVCIDPDPYSERVDKSCRVGGIATAVGKGAKSYVAAIEGISGGQGAPLTVTNIEEEAMPGRAQFKIYISNTGGGDVMHLDAIEEERCGFPSELSYRDFDYVYYIVTMNDPNVANIQTVLDQFFPLQIPGKQLDCSPKSPIRLDSTGKAIIYCNTAGFDFFGKTAYKTPLNIRLHYGYTNSIYKTIDIRSTT